MTRLAGAALLRLTLGRACAWALLVAGWVGIGSFALQFAPSVSWGFALVALWLVALGAAATVATRGGMRRWTRALALCAGVACTDFGLWWSVHGGGLGAVLLALAGWAALTALASGVVRSLRLAQSAAPAPPVAAAGLGALCAGLALGDPGDLPALANRLATSVVATGALLVLLQRRIDEGPRAPRVPCRPVRLFAAGLARGRVARPAAMADAVRRAGHVADDGRLAAHGGLVQRPGRCAAGHGAAALGAMFGPPLVLRLWIAHWSQRTLSVGCTLLLAAGAAFAAWASAPLNLLGLAVMHGAAWGLAWSGQLWAPAGAARKAHRPCVLPPAMRR